MPSKVKRNSSGGYTVSTPNAVHAKNTTKAKAEAQARLLNAVEHGWKPTEKSSKPGNSRGAYDTTHGEFCMKRATKHGVQMP